MRIHGFPSTIDQTTTTAPSTGFEPPRQVAGRQQHDHAEDRVGEQHLAGHQPPVADPEQRQHGQPPQHDQPVVVGAQEQREAHAEQEGEDRVEPALDVAP